MKKYIALYPQAFGLTEVEFVQTPKGYKASIRDDEWIGMPSSLIENNPQLFKRVRPRNNGQNERVVVGNAPQRRRN